MPDVYSEYHIALLIAKYIAENLSEDESKQLEDWKLASEGNSLLFDRLTNPKNFQELQLMSAQYDVNQAWAEMEKKINETKKFRIRKWMYYAAAAVILPLLFFYFYKNYFDTSVVREGDPLMAEMIKAGRGKATLVLDNGSEINLDDEETFLLEEKGSIIKKESSVLNYESKGNTEELTYNQINVPKGREFAVVLSDGSKVYLNAMSSLRYPVDFLSDSRTVELTGEAYFEVKKSDKIFAVMTQDTKIEVLGTSFNVSSYPDDEVVKTTLVEGAVKIDLLGTEETEEIFLSPSQQITFDRNTKKIQLSTVDVHSYIAWKDGLFYFKDWKLQEIMRYLSRWYDFDVIYENENIKNFRFGGKFGRYEDIDSVLKLLVKTEKISVEIVGNTIILKEKKE